MTPQTTADPATGHSAAPPVAADGLSAPSVATEQRRPSLSPSRAGDFRSCPMRYRLRVVDRIPEKASPAAARGTLVHAVLEHLFDLPAERRDLAAAVGMIAGEFERLRSSDTAFAEMVAEQDGDGDRWSTQWLAGIEPLLESYFALEDPRRIEPAEREQLVEAELDSGLLLRGFVDRLDVAPTGEVRVVDYKSGRSPGDAFAGQAMFQLRFYALALWRGRGVVPSQLRLMYLRDRDMLTYAPTEDELVRFERTLQSLWSAIERALESGDFRANRGRLCDWCDFRELCPAWGGTPPRYPGAMSLPTGTAAHAEEVSTP